MTTKLVLVDGNSIATAAYFGIPKLSTSNGIPTNALYGFINSIFKLMEDFPSHFGVVFDKGHSHRKAASNKYKSNRKPMDENLRVQYPLIKKFLDLMNIPHYAKKGYEGDDMLAIFTHKFHKQIPVFIASRDRDLFQLCAYPNTYVIYTYMAKGKAVTEVISASKVEERTGIRPDQLVYYKALAGDKSDEIPGVRGIGDKIAIKLIREHGDLKTIVKLAFEDKLKPPRLGKLIREGIKDLKESYVLGSLLIEDTHETLSEFKRKPANEKLLQQFYQELELKSFIN